MWNLFVENCMKSYIPSEFMTVDKQLVNFRGRVPFKCYIPTKPGKYSIKIWCLCDARNAYFINGQIYTGKDGTSPERNQGERIVRDLSNKFLDKGRNITCDNFFTTMSLAKYLQSRKTTLVGTVRKTRTFLPSEVCGNSSKVGTEFIFHDKKVTIVRYTEKQKSRSFFYQASIKMMLFPLQVNLILLNFTIQPKQESIPSINL